MIINPIFKFMGCHNAKLERLVGSEWTWTRTMSKRSKDWMGSVGHKVWNSRSRSCYAMPWWFGCGFEHKKVVSFLSPKAPNFSLQSPSLTIDLRCHDLLATVWGLLEVTGLDLGGDPDIDCVVGASLCRANMHHIGANTAVGEGIRRWGWCGLHLKETERRGSRNEWEIGRRGRRHRNFGSKILENNSKG